MNKYVNFVTDEDFLKCVEKVLNAYPSKESLESESFDVLINNKNTTDIFKVLFDMYYYQFDLDAWKHFEIIRQNDKSINNKIGEFHQNLLGCVEGWVDLGRGDETKVDLKNEDETIFIELKNKHNTMNASSSKTCRENLENILKKYPNATVYWAVIIDKNYISEDIPWEYKGNTNDQIRKISGDKLYALVTGKEDAYEQLFSVISSAINDILDADYYLPYLDHEKIEELKRKILNR